MLCLTYPTGLCRNNIIHAHTPTMKYLEMLINLNHMSLDWIRDWSAQRWELNPQPGCKANVLSTKPPTLYEQI